jgi:hypothetical protein
MLNAFVWVLVRWRDRASVRRRRERLEEIVARARCEPSRAISPTQRSRFPLV